MHRSFFLPAQAGKNRLNWWCFFVSWRHGDASYRSLDWPTVTKLTYTLGSPAHCREAFCSWRSCCTKKYFLLFSFSLFLVLVNAPQAHKLIERDGKKKKDQVWKEKTSTIQEFKHKRIVNLLFYWILITVSFSSTFPEARTQKYSKTHWDLFYYVQTSGLSGWQLVPAEP